MASWNDFRDACKRHPRGHRLQSLSPAAGLLPAGRAREEARIPSRGVLGPAGSRVRRPQGPAPDRGARAGGARREPHRPDVHGRLERLYEALHRFGFASRPSAVSRNDGLRLTDCYVSAAARCAPPGNKPTRAELERCRPYLEAELRLLTGIKVVIVLGRIAHDAWLKAAGWWGKLPPRRRPQFAHGATAQLPDGITLVSSYHPSRQNTNTRKLTREMWHGVFRKARRLLTT